MIIRRRHTANFTTIGNVLFEDERLEADEVGILAFLLSRPNDWEVRRPWLMRRFRYGRDGLRRVLRNLIRFGWIVSRVTRLSNGTVHILYEVRDEPGPELTADEAKAALSLVSSDVVPGETADGDGSEDGTDEHKAGAEPPDADPGGGSPPTGQPEAASRLRPSPPGYREEALKTESTRTDSPKRVRAFSDVKAGWPAEHMLSEVACETSFAGLTDADREAAIAGIKPYLADCAAASRKVCDLRTYLHERRWQRLAAIAEQAALKPAVFKVYTPNWYRWLDYRKATGLPTAFMESQARSNPHGVWSERTEWPPAMPAKPAGSIAPQAEADATAEEDSDIPIT